MTLLLLLVGHREACLILALLIGLEEIIQTELGSQAWVLGVEG